jgi:ABC-2 type transport system ATP-binding protein
MDMLEMGGFLNQPVRQLSLGQRVKADLAAALLHNPQTVFLDEPTIGVDAVAKERLRQFIRDINQIRGVTVLLTTHDMVDMEKLVNRVLVIDAGRIAYDGTIHRLREQYGRNRRLDVVFAEHSPHIDVPGLVQVAAAPYRRSYTFNQQEMSAEKALGLIMNQPFTIRDITIQEADIEEIIRNLYTAKGM